MIEDWKVFDKCPMITIPPVLTALSIERLIVEQLKIDSKCRHFILVLSSDDWLDYAALEYKFESIKPTICNKICDNKIYFFRLVNSLFFNPESCCVVGQKDYSKGDD